MNADLTYLEDVLDSIELIHDYLDGIRREEFLADSLLKDAVSWRFLVIGEAVKRISDELKESNPQVSWPEIVGFRNVLAHQYTDLSYPQIWSITKQDLPGLKTQVSAIYEEMSPAG